jgi:hypothetical protein
VRAQLGAAILKKPKAMPTLSIEKSRNPKSVVPKKGGPKSQAPSRHKIPSAATAKTTQRSVESKAAPIDAAKAPVNGDEPKVGRVTKRERVLSLLSRSEGASIAEMMQATDWQQHSVRGFLAGTVKKKLGFLLTTSKAAGDVRRYRMETRRGR